MNARRLTRLGLSFIPALAIVLVLGVAAVQNVAAQTETRIEIGDNFFNPASATVTVGTMVTWMHMGTRPHDVTSEDGMLNSPRRLMNGQTYSFTVTTPGTINYVCTIHQGMSGTLIVQAAPATGGTTPAAPPSTGGGGMASPSLLPWLLVTAAGVLACVGASVVARVRGRAS